MIGKAPLHCFSKTKGLQDCNAWKLSKQTQFPYRTGIISVVVTPKDNAKNDKTPLQNHISLDSGKKVTLFCKKKNILGGIVERTFLNIKN